MNRMLYSMIGNGKRRVVSKRLETHNTITSPNPRSWLRPTLLNSVAWPPFGGSYQPGEAACQNERVSGLGGIREFGSHIGWEVVHRREEHRCREWKRGEEADHRMDLVS